MAGRGLGRGSPARWRTRSPPRQAQPAGVGLDGSLWQAPSVGSARQSLL